MKNKMQTVKNANDSFIDYSDIFEQRYYKIQKRILCFIGQWPYQSDLQRTVRTFLIMFLTFSLLIPQIMKLIDSCDEVEIFIECFSAFLTNLGGNMKLINFIINTKKIRSILDETRNDWNDIRYLPDVEILREYGEKGRRCTIIYIIFINSVVAAWITTPYLTVLMDYVAPLNQSRPHIILFQAHYKVDPDKYFYSILVHGSIVCAVGIQMIVAIDVFYMSIAQHTCSMFDILRSHLENIIQEEENLRVILRPDLREDVYYQKIITCIKRHKSIIEYVQFVESSCEWCLFVVIGINMLIMSCTGSQIVATGTSIQNLIRFTFFTVAQVVHLYCNTLPGQWIMDSSSRLSVSVYNCKWHLLSLRSRQLIILFLRRSIEPCTITAGRMYVMSMENFAAVLQTSMSYFTLLTSMQ